MNYFDHDTDASSNMRIMGLRAKCGGAAVDAYWTVVETICEEQAPLPSDMGDFRYLAMARILFTDPETLASWVEAMVEVGLLVRDETGIYSKRALDNCRKYDTQRENARKAGRSSANARKAKSSESASQRDCSEVERSEDAPVETETNECSTDVEQPLNECSTMELNGRSTKEKEKEKDSRTIKGSTNPLTVAFGGAAAAPRAAPASAKAPTCPKCGDGLETIVPHRDPTRLKLWCGSCHEEFSGAEARWSA